MRPYELMVIFEAGLEDEAVQAVLDRITAAVQGAGGTAGRVDKWGRRRFAYEVRHRHEGYYVVVELRAEPAVVAELDRMLFLADEVIRHKAIRLPDRVGERPSRTLPSEAVADVGREAGA